MDALIDRATGGPDAGDGSGRPFIAWYLLAYTSTCLLLIAPLLVTLALKVDDLVGIDRAPGRLSLIAAAGSVVSMVGNPVFGRLSDRTVSSFGMRRPWMLIGLAGGTIGILVVALAPNILVVLVGWCVAQLFFNALLAAQVAVLPDQVPGSQRGAVAGLLGVAVPVASVAGTYVVDLFAGNDLLMFLAPCAIGGFFVVAFTVVLPDRRLAIADRPAWTRRELARTFYVAPKGNPDFGWAFASRFLFVLAYAFLVTYQAYYLIDELGQPEAEVPHLIFTAVLIQSVLVVAASLVGGLLSDRTGRRKVFVVVAGVDLRRRAGGGGHRERTPRLPGRHGDRWPRLRSLHGGRPGVGGGRAAEPGRERQGPRSAEHRRRAALLHRAGPGPARAGRRWGSYPVLYLCRRLRAGRGRRDRAGQRVRYSRPSTRPRVVGLAFSGSCRRWVTETSGRPRSRTFSSSPCRAAWSVTSPRMSVSPPSGTIASPSNQADHRPSMRPWTRIS